jgi:hypothetical protein
MEVSAGVKHTLAGNFLSIKRPLRIGLCSWSRAPTNYEFRFDDNFFGIGPVDRSVYATQNRLRGKNTHVPKWLLYRREARVLKRRALNVIKAHHRSILRYAPPCFAQSLDGADRRDIVECEQSRKGLTRREEFLGNTIPKFR